MILFYLSSGLFLGWSLGGNDAANVFGTAVGSRMLRFRTAAIICSLFVVIGAISGGGGTTHTLGKLGAVDAIAGSFMVALAAAITVMWMTKVGLPVSTSQAIVGAIIGWNFFAGRLTNWDSLRDIVLTWVVCPVLSGLIAASLYRLMRASLNRTRIHLLTLDMYTRLGLLLVGAFGAYSLGANNIANVMGVFVSASPFDDFKIGGQLILTSEQLLFLVGGLAIATGVFTYSHKVIRTVGASLMKLSPEAALIVVLAQALVLFLFASEDLESFLQSRNLPTLPLVPVSSSQAVVGAILGIGFAKGGKGFRYRTLGEIGSGWVTTPICAGLLAFVSLFFLQNVFHLDVAQRVNFCLDQVVIEKLALRGVKDPGLLQLEGREYDRAQQLDLDLRQGTALNRKQRYEVVETAECVTYRLDPELIRGTLDSAWFSQEQLAAVENLAGSEFQRAWELLEALEAETPGWRIEPDATKAEARDLEAKRQFMLRTFRERDGS
jgi:PiT family inorganic phosphate transporter